MHMKKGLLDNGLAPRHIDGDQQLELGKGIAFVSPFFSFLLHAILIPGISSLICLLSPDSVFGDTALSLGWPMTSCESIKERMKEDKAPRGSRLCPSFIPFPKLKVNILLAEALQIHRVIQVTREYLTVFSLG